MRGKTVNDCKSMYIRIYGETVYSLDDIRIVAIGRLDKTCEFTLENMTMPKRYISADEAKEKLIEYGGIHIHKNNDFVDCVIKITGKKRMREVMEWIDSLALIYKMAGGV